MKKSFKQMTSLLLAGLMVFQSTPALAAAVDTTRTALSNVVATESTYVAEAGRTASPSTPSETTPSDATASDVEGITFAKETYNLGAVDEVESVTLTGTLKLASGANWALTSATDLEALFTYETDNDYLGDLDLTITGDDHKTFDLVAAVGEFEGSVETKVTLSVKDADISAVANVTMSKGVIEDDLADSIKFTENEVTLKVGDSKELEVEASPSNASLEGLAFESTDDAVVKVDSNGTIEAVAVGNAKIIATLESGGETLTAECTITVEDEDFDDLVDMIYVNPVEMTLEVGQEGALEVTASPSDASLEDVVFESSDETVASVSEDGKVVALAEGEAVITASLVSGEKTLTAECTVTVTKTSVEDALDNLLESAKDAFNKEDPTSEANREVVNTMVSGVLNLDMDEETLNSEEVVALIQEMEAFLVEVGFYGKTEVAADETVGLTLEVPVGLLLSLDPMTDAGKTPVLTATKVSESDVRVPAGNRRAYAVDISILLNGDVNDKVTDLKLPITLTTTVPETLTAAAARNRLNVYHYHGGNDVTPDKLAVTLLADGRISFQVKGFSTFVLAEAYTGGGSGGSGGGGGSVSGAVSSIPNLSGTWMQNETGWWFALSSGGYVSNGWGRINNQWYYFNAEGYMATGWIQVAGVWYFLQPYGAMVENDWVFSGGNWYFLSPSGALVASDWVQYKDNWYYMTADGSMAVSTTTPDGFVVDANGVWVQ